MTFVVKVGAAEFDLALPSQLVIAEVSREVAPADAGPAEWWLSVAPRLARQAVVGWRGVTAAALGDDAADEDAAPRCNPRRQPY
jgi:hypothetical protein